MSYIVLFTEVEKKEVQDNHSGDWSLFAMGVKCPYPVHLFWRAVACLCTTETELFWDANIFFFKNAFISRITEMLLTGYVNL